MKLGKIQFLKNITARGSFFVVGKTDFPASGNYFFHSIFPTPASFSRQVEKYFSTKSFIPAGRNGFSGQWKAFSFARSFSSKWKPVSKTNESQFLKKGHILTNEN